MLPEPLNLATCRLLLQAGTHRSRPGTQDQTSDWQEPQPLVLGAPSPGKLSCALGTHFSPMTIEECVEETKVERWVFCSRS